MMKTDRRVSIALTCIMLVALLLSGCGGGFGSDSVNAPEFGDAIFGPDSTRNR